MTTGQLDPRVIQRRNGGVLVVSHPLDTLKIGVTAGNIADGIALFRAEHAKIMQNLQDNRR